LVFHIKGRTYVDGVSRRGGLRRIFGPNREEVPARWRKQRNGELQGFYSSIHVVPGQVTEDEKGWESGTYDG
jgi:hypothetical protein